MIKKYAEKLSGNFLGHSSVETTKDHYAFPSLEQLRKAMEAGKHSDADIQPF
jgi:hypothetical protein